MAIARGAGTEIIRSVHLEDVDDTASILIYGEQHHIYTVLSVICFAATLSVGNYIQMRILGYDSFAGTTNSNHFIFRHNMSALETFVWNDKFSFNGAEPANFTGPMDDATKQNAIADQGSTPVSQYLKFNAEGSGDRIDVVCTFIDQNNA